MYSFPFSAFGSSIGLPPGIRGAVEFSFFVLSNTLVKLTSRGPALYWSCRVGRDGRLFRMPKFRSMTPGTPEVPKHLVDDPQSWMTPFGRFLRRTSLDELPQVWSILVGDMSFVGPRPALHNYDDIIAERRKRGIERLKPGLTGWAQINGRDELSVADTVAYDEEYMKRADFLFDLRILARTAVVVLRQDDIAH